MDNRKSILVLYSRGVYDSAALAVVAELEKTHHKEVYVCPIADDELTAWKKATIRRKSYVFFARNMPVINKWSCAMSRLFVNGKIRKTKRDYKEFKRPTTGFNGWIYRVGGKYRRVFNALARFEPDVVLCTTPDLLSKAVKAKYNLNQTNVSVCAMITDYQLDKKFIHHKADGYFVQNQSIKDMLVNHGIDEDIVTVIGTPMGEDIKMQHDKAEVMEELGISDGRINLVVVGGRYGNARLKEVFSKCLELTQDFNVIMMTGDSDSINKYCTYVATNKNASENIYIVEKVDSMSKIYAIADIIITLPTGQVTYEALYHSKPIIVLKGSDRVENMNAHYLTTNGLALRGITPEEVIASIAKYLDDQPFAEENASTQAAFAAGEGVANIVPLLLAAAEVHYLAKQDLMHKREEILSETKPTLPTPKSEIDIKKDKK